MQTVRQFSAEDFAARERVVKTQAVVSEVLTRIEIHKVDDKPLVANINSINLPNTTLASFDLGPLVFDRSAELVQDGDDRFSLVACVGGQYEILTPDGQYVTVSRGMAGLVSHRQPSRTKAVARNQEKTLVFPRELISHALRNPDARIGAVPEGGMVSIRLMSSYMEGLLNEPQEIPDRLKKTIEGHVLDLVANAYDPTGEWSRAAPNGGVNAARLKQILDHVSIGFADPGLNAERIAAAYGMSPRLVHQTLTVTGTTLSQHVLERRLQAAREILQNERFNDKRVSDIALEVGFSDVSYFNRCFRARFGDTPTGFRR